MLINDTISAWEKFGPCADRDISEGLLYLQNINNKISLILIPTNKVQVNKVAPNGLCAYLALINSSIAFLRPFYLQSPFVVFRVMISLKSLVAGICVAAHCQDMNVSMSNPRDLELELVVQISSTSEQEVCLSFCSEMLELRTNIDTNFWRIIGNVFLL